MSEANDTTKIIGPSPSPQRRHRALDVGATFMKLGLTSFGGPVAHIAYFRREFVERRQWLDDAAFADLVALCQFLPGPASSQVGFAIGLLRAGWLGALAAWTGFTLPSVLLLIGFAMVAPDITGKFGTGAIHGLKLAAVAVVAQAVWDMARRFCADVPRAVIALAAICVTAMVSPAYSQLLVIFCGATLGIALCRSDQPRQRAPGATSDFRHFHVSKGTGLAAGALFFGLLLALPSLARIDGTHAIAEFNAFYHAGALVFGGGHVILPLLQQQTVEPGWVTQTEFVAGYGAAQAIPGPLSTFAAYLGWVAVGVPNRCAGATLATVGVFLPGLLLIVSTLPFWQSLRRRSATTAAMAGVNAAVVGLLAMALYFPVWTSAVGSFADAVVACIALMLLTRWRTPTLFVVTFSACAGLAEVLVGYR